MTNPTLSETTRDLQISEAAPLTIALQSIRRDDALICRACGVKRATAAEYCEAMKAGATFPPVVVFRDAKGVHWLADGFHRCSAAEQVGLTEIAVDIREGGRREALLYAASANAQHGLRRTNADKRRAVELVLKSFPRWSDRKIGDACGVDHKTVCAARAREPRGEIPHGEASGEIPQHAKAAKKIVKTLDGLIGSWPAGDAEGRALFAEALRAAATRLAVADSAEQPPEATPKPVARAKGKTAKASKAQKAVAA
jgi:hypothetical protein